MDHTIWLMNMDGYEYQVFLTWIWMDMDLLNFLSMDMGGYGFYQPHPCQSLHCTKQLTTLAKQKSDNELDASIATTEAWAPTMKTLRVDLPPLIIRRSA